MTRTGKARKKRFETTRREWPLVVYVWIIGLGVASYTVARVTLDGQPHPLHWIAGLLGGLAGCLIGWLWYRWRGDIV